MLRFDKATYLSLLFKFILSERLINSLPGLEVLLFSKFCVITVLNSLYCYTLFQEFLFLEIKSIIFDGFYLVSFQMYYLFLLVQMLLVIFEVFV